LPDGSQKKTDIIAKNLLEGKVCNKCKHYIVEKKEVVFCGRDVPRTHDPQVAWEYSHSIPEENTCECWKPAAAPDWKSVLKTLDGLNNANLDWDAISKDWEAIGKDFKSVLGDWSKWSSKK